MTAMTTAALKPIERIAIGGQLGGIVRDGVERMRRCKVHVVNADGNVVRVTDLAEVHQKLRERVGIEFDVYEDRRPTKATCPCGRIFTTRVLPNGHMLAVCPECQNQKVCAGWDGRPCPHHAKPLPSALLPGAIRYRQGAPWRCPRCKYKMREERKREARGGTCPNGHLRTPDNLKTHTSADGRVNQTCLTCYRAAVARGVRRAANRAVANGLCRDCKKQKIDPKSKSRCRDCLNRVAESSKAKRAAERATGATEDVAVSGARQTKGA